MNVRLRAASIFQRSCVACHTKASPEPAGNLVRRYTIKEGADVGLVGPQLRWPEGEPQATRIHRRLGVFQIFRKRLRFCYQPGDEHAGIP